MEDVADEIFGEDDAFLLAELDCDDEIDTLDAKLGTLEVRVDDVELVDGTTELKLVDIPAISDDELLDVWLTEAMEEE